MKLKDIREAYEELTGKASELNRKCVFAGIAAIWIFRDTESASSSIPVSFQTPMCWFILSMALDILQYTISGTIWLIYYRVKKYHSVNADFEEENVREPECLNYITDIMWLLKIASTIIGFCFLGGSIGLKLLL